MADEAALLKLCDVADVRPDTPAQARVGGQGYAIFSVDGAIYVTQDLCTHGPGYLSDGYVEGREVECPIHQGRFDICTGRATSAPCTEPLRIWAAHIRDGAVMIDPAQGQVHAP